MAKLSQQNNQTFEYLGLDLSAQKKITPAHVFIAIIPMNSSGDIYHVLTYLILAAAQQCNLPNVMLTWDTEEIKAQVKRSEHLLNTLGFHQTLQVVQLDRSNQSYREAARQLDLVKYFEQKANTEKARHVYFDQMACTTIIADYFEEHSDEASRLVREQLQHMDPQYFPKSVKNSVNDYVKNELQKITTYQQAKNKPVILMHMRYSNKANEDKNIPADFALKLTKYLEERGYCLWYILADSRKNNLTHYDARHESKPFSDPLIEKAINGETYEYGKHKHLLLLKSCYELNTVAGVIGNTSGTLDICAFMGYRVFNIHQFGYQLTYQDYRIMIQTTLMHVGDLDLPKMRERYKKISDVDAETLLSKTVRNLTDWVDDCELHIDDWLSPEVRAKTLEPKIYYYENETETPTFSKLSKKHGFDKMLRFTIFNPGKSASHLTIQGARSRHEEVITQLKAP